MTLSVREGRFPIASFLMCNFFIFVGRHVVTASAELHLKSTSPKKHITVLCNTSRYLGPAIIKFYSCKL